LPDPIVPDASAGSSPAAEPSSVASPALDLDTLSETDLQAWRMTGEVPRTSPVTTSPAESSPAPAVQDPPASTDAPAQATSELADTDPDYKPKTAKRIQELLTRAERAERALAERTAATQPPPDRVAPAASTTAPAGSALVKPDPESFPYGTADPGYVEALTAFKVTETLNQERAAVAEQQRQARAQDESRRVMSAFDAKAAAARTKHPDFDAVALLAPTEIPQGSIADLVVLEDEAGAEILYHLQQPANAGERRRILALGPREQFKELILLGHRLTADPAAARSTNAPPPPPTLQTRPSPGDPVERALASGDTAAYNAAMNARDLARLKD
jgi:hypothetical protein